MGSSARAEEVCIPQGEDSAVRSAPISRCRICWRLGLRISWVVALVVLGDCYHVRADRFDISDVVCACASFPRNGSDGWRIIWCHTLATEVSTPGTGITNGLRYCVAVVGCKPVS